jgi:2-octaprenyl-6-methoxyphenol hydroxylase
MNDQTHYEVIVVGGGMTGVMMALALSYGGYGSPTAPAIALVERAPARSKIAQPASVDTVSPNSRLNSTISPSGDHRTTTIHAAGKTMLETLGVWPLIGDMATPITRIKIAHGAPRQSSLARRQRPEFSLDWHDADQPMAYVVANDRLLDALYAVIATRPIAHITDAEVINFDGAGDLAQLQFANRPDLTCQLVVACDGAKSKLRDYAGIQSFAEQHRQTAIVANLTLERDHANIAYQRFLPSGPLALMPHGPLRASLVWTLPRAKADHFLALEEANFANVILAAFGETLGVLRVDGPRLGWPLEPTISLKMTGPHLVLAGDASHAIHPLAGQGYNLALGDAAVLADCLARASARGLGAGHRSVETDYLAGRKLEVIAMTAMTSGLNQLMSFQPAIAKVTGAGMGLVNATPIQSFLQKSAMGGHLARANLLEGYLPAQ